MTISDGQLRNLQRKISSVEKDKYQIQGKLESELNILSGLLGDCDPEDAEQKSIEMVADLQNKRKKANRKLLVLFEDIEKQAEKLGLEL